MPNMRPPRRIRKRRTSDRDGGSSSAKPRMSVMNPGVIRKAPPKITSTPSKTSRCGMRPDCIASWKRPQTVRPCDLISQVPSSESITSSASVGSHPIESPTLKITYSSAIGTTMNTRMSRIIGRSEATNLSVVPSVDDVEEALTNVIDPELGLDFVELGLIYEIEVEGPEVYVTFTLTSPGCPIGPQVADQIKEYVAELEGVEKVHPKMVFTPPWTPELMSEDAKFALGY